MIKAPSSRRPARLAPYLNPGRRTLGFRPLGPALPDAGTAVKRPGSMRLRQWASSQGLLGICRVGDAWGWWSGGGGRGISSSKQTGDHRPAKPSSDLVELIRQKDGFPPSALNLRRCRSPGCMAAVVRHIGLLLAGRQTKTSKQSSGTASPQEGRPAHAWWLGRRLCAARSAASAFPGQLSSPACVCVSQSRCRARP